MGVPRGAIGGESGEPEARGGLNGAIGLPDIGCVASS
jgi:hypothetical protein